MSTSSTATPSCGASLPSSSRARSHRWQSRATYSRTVLGIQAPDRARLDHALDGDAVGGGAERDVARLVQVPRVAERAADDLTQPLVDLGLGPEELLQALHPLEVRDDD